MRLWRLAGLLACAYAWAAAPARAETNLSERPIHFGREVMAVLSKAGCNTGPCHGNANGKAGFKLSLRGEDPAWDYRALAYEQGSRRINLVDPDQSLILLKPTAQLPHEGGKRFAPDSEEYQLLRRWIERGAAPDAPGLAAVTRIEAEPAEAVLNAETGGADLRVRAHYADGQVRDVTRLAVFESSDPRVRINAQGRVQVDGPLEATVVARYLSAQTPVRLAFVPPRPGFEFHSPPVVNRIDEEIFAKLRARTINPSPLASDSVFLRRVYLDLIGLIPTADETREFLANALPDKRTQLVARLLERPEFADYWALKWADLLRAEERLLDRKGLEVFHGWLRDSFATNKPLDRLARDLIAAQGSTYQNPPANFYRAIRQPEARAEAVAQVFLGVRLNCAQCHNHPFDRWTQDDYYDWASVFGRIDYKVLENRRRDSNDSHEFKGEQIVFLGARNPVKNPRTGEAATPRFLGELAAPDSDAQRNRSALVDAENALEELARWITAPRNPLFARVQVNRIWFHLFGRGLVDPIDDFRPTNPPSHPELLDWLADEFAARQFDLKWLIRLITASSAYQLSPVPNETNTDDEINFSRAYVRRLAAEQLLDCQSQVTGAPLRLPGYPAGTRAAQVRGALSERRRDQRKSEIDQFLETFGKPARLLTCECERSSEATMGQAFQMISGPALQQLLIDDSNRLTALARSERSTAQIVDELFLAALSRAPTGPETTELARRLQAAPDRRQAVEDLAWALINSKEFMLRK